MFGLPLGTSLLVIGFPIFWILYTIVFLVVSRNWGNDSSTDNDPS
ncbi:MAG: hypothetical protein ACR2Q3_13720 [Woeseiaceae bacterium]